MSSPSTTTNTSAHPLFEPITIGPVQYPNRIVMAPLTRGRAGQKRIPNDKMMEYYTLRASAGLIITEATHISEQGIGWEQSPGIHLPEQIAGWKKITEAVHHHGGRIFLQLWHVGRASHSYFNGLTPVSSSAVPKDTDDPVYTDEGKLDPEVPLAMSEQDIAKTIMEYKTAAINALDAGFDGVEIHAANGYLIDQFLRDGVNQRTDRYGGSPENRFTFLREVIEAVTEVWESTRVGVRLSPTNPFNSMTDSDPVALFTTVAQELNAYDLAYLHLLEAPPGIDHPMAAEDVPYVAPEIRKLYQGRLILNAGYDFESGNQALTKGDADFIAYGVPYIANPDLVERFAQNEDLNEPDQSTFYTHGEEGYLDYPILQTQGS